MLPDEVNQGTWRRHAYVLMADVHFVSLMFRMAHSRRVLGGLPGLMLM